jgi:hypothetical protein
MKQVISNRSGSYFVKGKLMTGSKDTATVFTDDDSANEALDSLDSLGVLGVLESLPEDTVDTASVAAEIDAIIASLTALKATVGKIKGRKKYTPTPAQQDKIDNQQFSFGIRFIRAKALTEVKGPGGWVPSPGLTVVSERTFGTKSEATNHAKRFRDIEGHYGFEIIEVDSPPNAWVNEKTGKTNPVIGLKRTNR